MKVPTLNLCLDLNIWCAAFLADQKKMEGTATQTLVRMARAGRVGDMPVQLVISWIVMRVLEALSEREAQVNREMGMGGAAG